MVFSSIPVYLDPPNWQQQQNHHNTLGNTTENHQLPPLPPPPVLPSLSHVAGPSSGSGSASGSATGSIRPGSMADRARMAKIPQPEAALKCPRCESTNTKFCYFNNYSLTQPRHFCKTCRRYWTRGGALRNVPVGGGCRRNKKSKSSGGNRSKSPASASDHKQISGSGVSTPGSNSNPSGGMISPTGSNGAEMIGHFSQNHPQPHHHSSFMASIQNLARFGGGGGVHGGLGLNFSEIQGQGQTHHHDQAGNLGFQIGSGANSGDQSGMILQGSDQWRLQQFPLMGGHDFESQTGNLYPFHGQLGVEAQSGNSMVGMINSGGSTRVSQFPSVKLEGRQGLNLSTRPSLGISENNNQFWGGNSNNTTTAWTDLSGLNSSSTSHLL